MKAFALSLLACVAIGAAASPVASARGATAGTQRVTSLRVVTSRDASDDSGSPRQPRGSSRKDRQQDPASDATQKSRLAEMKLLRRALGEQRKADAHEKAEVAARADRIYTASQFSAPIIVDAKACRRVGANGESIYENC